MQSETDSKRVTFQIWPHTPGDGGILCCPMLKNIPEPRDKTWELIDCPICGRGCWSTEMHKETLKKEPNLKHACTECGIRMELQKTDKIHAFTSAAQYLPKEKKE